VNSSLTAFLCSTYSDLADEREAVLDAIRKLQIQHDAMEFFGARTHQPIETCLEEVRRSDVLVVVVGHRYGSLVPERGVSFSEAEYTEGHRLGKPCLVYLRDENVPVLPRHVERDPEKVRLLEAFKERLLKRHTVALFTDANDLAVRVAADLGKTAHSLQEAARIESESPGLAGPPAVAEITTLVADALERGVEGQALVSAVRRALRALLEARGQRRPTLFFSYSHADQETARALASRVQDRGLDVWIDVDRVAAGASIVAEVTRGLDAADCLVVLLSRASLQSRWVMEELNIVVARRLSNRAGAVVLPVLLEDVEVPAVLRDVKYLDLRDRDVARGAEELVSAVHHHVGREATGGVDEET